MNVDDILEVQVNKVDPSYVLIEYQGVEATLQVTELTWDAGVIDVNNYVTVGDTIRVRVTAILDDKYSVTLRDCIPSDNPWLDPVAIGMEFNSPVILIVEYGYFFKINNYCHALLLKENTTKIYTKNQVVRLIISDVDAKKQRVLVEERSN